MPAGDVIKLSSPATRGFWEIAVVYEDEHLIALDKPSGLLTSPDRFDPELPNLMTLLHTGAAAGKPWSLVHNRGFLANAHRLDGEISGIVLLAKSKPVLVTLTDMFGSEKPVQYFTALVNGSPPEDQFEVDAKIGAHPLKEGLMRIDPRNGKRSRTRFEVLERFHNQTLLRCQPLTSRMHQIRVHLRWRRLPVTGDELYRGAPLKLSRIKRRYQLKHGEEERPLMGRVAIHAGQLNLPHPVTGEMLTLTAPWPKDFAIAVKYLRKYAK